MSFDTDPREYECPCCNEYEKQRLEDKKLIAELLEVVEFYGEKDNWRKNHQVQWALTHQDDVEKDQARQVGGKKARAILNSEIVKRFNETI